MSNRLTRQPTASPAASPSVPAGWVLWKSTVIANANTLSQSFQASTTETEEMCERFLEGSMRGGQPHAKLQEGDGYFFTKHRVQSEYALRRKFRCGPPWLDPGPHRAMGP